VKLIFKEVVMMNRDSDVATAAACRKKEENPGRWLVRIVIFLCLLGMLSGCAPTIYNVNMRYEPTKVIPPAVTDGRKYSLTVASFTDQRKMEDTLLIGRVIKSNGTPIPILPRYVKPTDAVAAALRDVFVKSGYAVAPGRPAWDLNETTIRPEWGTILVGGTIDTLDVTCVETLTMKRYSATVRVSLIFADVQKKKIFYRLVSESSSSLDHIFLSEARLESQINGVLSDAIEKALEGPEIGRQIRETLKP
jgi:hypothetical protein